ncbi:TonB-dependent receptor [Echinicola sediminis]
MVLKELEEKTHLRFTFNDSYLKPDQVRVNMEMKNQSLATILGGISAQTNLKFTRINDNIHVSVVLSDADSKIEEIIHNVDLKEITGKVVSSEDGEPLPGVTVKIKGSQTGTVTDIDGNYLINATDGDVLVFSFVGYKIHEQIVQNQSVVDVVLEQDLGNLEEVVVVGYGTTTKSKMVSSISTIGTKEIGEAPFASVVQGLAGRAPGLFARESGGEYGSVPSISIRGGGEPIYVIDGIIASKNEFALIPPNDIDEVSLLKDAAAAAVYGFNSANGVVLVTTKKGKEGKISISYSGDFSFQQPTLIPKYLSPYDKALLKNSAAHNDGLPQVIGNELLDTLRNNWDPVKYPNLNPFDLAVNDFSGQQRHNIGLNGSVKDTRIFMSLDYLKQNGIYSTSSHGLDRFSLRSNISQHFKKIGLTLDGNVSLQRNVTTGPPAGTWTIWSHVRNWGSGNPFYNPNGNYYGLENPLAEADSRAGYIRNENNRVNTRLVANWKVPHVDGLSLKAVGNYRMEFDFGKNWYANQRNSAPTYSWDNQLNNMGNPSLSQSTGRSYQYDVEGHINYLKTFNEQHTVELMGVVSNSEWRWDGFNAYRRDYISPSVDQLFAGSSEGKDNGGNASEGARLGYIARLKYDFKEKYVFEGNFRYDGNDNFPSTKRFGLFPSLSLGWNMDREEFLLPVMSQLKVSTLKVRGSWGLLGSTGDVARFAYIPVYNLSPNRYYTGGVWRAGFQEGNLVSDNLSWFDRESMNFAVDFGFFESKLEGTFDWFYYRTSGFLASPSDRYTTPLGKNLPQINTNSAQRRGGVEGSLNYRFQIGQWKMNMGGNVSYYDQLWERKFDEDSTSLKNPERRLTHQKDYYTIGYLDQGYYGSMEEIINSPRRLGSTETMSGDLKYKDYNGDGRIDADDQVRIGKADFPHVIYGINLGGQYRALGINVLMQGAGNRHIYLGGMWQNEINHKLYQIQADNWTPENPNALFPRISSFNQVNGGNNVVTSSFWLKNAWYLRMKSISLTYDMKKVLFSNFDGVDNCTLLLSATNLFTISPMNDYYIDPETSSSDNYGYPVQRTFNVGLRVSF